MTKYKLLNHKKIEVVEEVTITYDLSVLKDTKEELETELDYVTCLINLIEKKDKGEK